MQPTVSFETLHGGRPLGLARAVSDADLQEVIVGPLARYRGFVGGVEQIELGSDHVGYEIRKLFWLAIEANPTALERRYAYPTDRCILAAGLQSLPSPARPPAPLSALRNLVVAQTRAAISRLELGAVDPRWLGPTFEAEC